jgi:hypothetical protein
LVADLKADRFGADLLHIWESSRGSRRVGEWVTLIELCEERRVGIAVTTHGRTYDPANPRDRRTLLEDAVDSEYESAKLSTRAKRATAANAADGKPHGRIPFGYRRRYDPVTRRLVAQEPEPTEAPVVVELFERLGAGHSLRGIAADFERRGVRSRSGIVFSAQALRSMALRPLYAGQRSHVAGKMTQRERHRRATLTDGQWPALVDRATFLAVQRRLGDPARKTTRGGGARHLLSMIARCDVCGGPLAATHRRGTREYGCRGRGHVRIDADELDAAADDEIVTYLSRPDQVDELVADEGHDEALAAARDEVAAIKDEHKQFSRRVGRGELSPLLAAEAEPLILERLEAAQNREYALATPSALRELLGSGDDVDDVVAHWRDAPIAAKRELVRLLAVPGKLGELRVRRSPSPGHRVPVDERIVWKR